MSPVDRPLSGPVLRFRLSDERERADDPVLLERHGRNARTLVKAGPLRVTLVRVAAGGTIAPHRSDGPISVQVLDGDIRLRAAGTEHALGPGDLLVVEGAVEHAVESSGGGTFLLTVVQPEAGTRG
jgi:quercetin dioxygenase-like cupin family protein